MTPHPDDMDTEKLHRITRSGLDVALQFAAVGLLEDSPEPDLDEDITTRVRVVDGLPHVEVLPVRSEPWVPTGPWTRTDDDAPAGTGSYNARMTLGTQPTPPNLADAPRTVRRMMEQLPHMDTQDVATAIAVLSGVLHDCVVDLVGSSLPSVVDTYLDVWPVVGEARSVEVGLEDRWMQMLGVARWFDEAGDEIRVPQAQPPEVGLPHGWSGVVGWMLGGGHGRLEREDRVLSQSWRSYLAKARQQAEYGATDTRLALRGAVPQLP